MLFCLRYFDRLSLLVCVTQWILSHFRPFSIRSCAPRHMHLSGCGLHFRNTILLYTITVLLYVLIFDFTDDHTCSVQLVRFSLTIPHRLQYLVFPFVENLVGNNDIRVSRYTSMWCCKVKWKNTNLIDYGLSNIMRHVIRLILYFCRAS